MLENTLAREHVQTHLESTGVHAATVVVKRVREHISKRTHSDKNKNLPCEVTAASIAAVVTQTIIVAFAILRHRLHASQAAVWEESPSFHYQGCYLNVYRYQRHTHTDTHTYKHMRI